MKMNREAYEDLIRGDLAWLDREPRTLEREHIAEVLRGSVDLNYPPVTAESRTAAVLRLEDRGNHARVWVDVMVDGYSTPILVFSGPHHQAEGIMDGRLRFTAGSRLVDGFAEEAK
jgi:hypothetical protein